MSATVSSWVRTASAVGWAKTGADLHAGLGLDHFLQQPFGGLAPRPSAERSDSSRRSRSCRDKATMYPLGSSAPFTPAVRGPWRPRRHGRTVVSAGSGLRYWSGDALAGSARMLGDRRRARRRHGRTDSSASRLSGTSKSRGRGSRSGTTAVDAPKSSWLRRRGTGSTRRRAGSEHTRCSIPEVGWRCSVTWLSVGRESRRCMPRPPISTSGSAGAILIGVVPPLEEDVRGTDWGWGLVDGPGGLFGPTIVRWYPTVQWFTGDGFADHLRSLSLYRKLDRAVREPLLDAVAERIRTRMGDRASRRYLSVLRMGRRAPDAI